MSASAVNDSGSGSALSSIQSAALSLGSAAVASQLGPTRTNVPTTAYPAYGASAPMSSSSTIAIVLVIIVAIGGLFFAMKG